MPAEELVPKEELGSIEEVVPAEKGEMEEAELALEEAEAWEEAEAGLDEATRRKVVA